MSEEKKSQRSEEDAALEREIRRGRQFTLEEAIGRLAGPGAMKGVSPVAQMQQAEFKIDSWLRSHLIDPGGQLKLVVLRHIKGSEILSSNFDQPLVVLADYCHRVLGSEHLAKVLVRELDVEWARVMGERPHFDREGAPSHPDDPYTIPSVKSTLSELLEQLAAEVEHA